MNSETRNAAKIAFTDQDYQAIEKVCDNLLFDLQSNFISGIIFETFSNEKLYEEISENYL